MHRPFWSCLQKLFDVMSSCTMGMCFGGRTLTQPLPQGFSTPIFWGKTLETRLIFTQYLTQTWKWLIIEATTLHRPNNKRYLKLTSMSSSIIKKVIHLPPVSAASWQRNWLASVSAQLKEMVWMGTGFKSWTWASMDDGGWKGKVKGVKIYIVCCNRDLIWSDNRDVRENVAEKYISHPFKPFRDYPKSPCYLKEGNLG